MTRHKSATPATNRDGLIADLRMLAELAETGGDRVSAVRALKLAWRIEHVCPIKPVPLSIDRAIALVETIAPMIRRVAPGTLAE
ncbi:hypothetical protein FHT86_003512 [Rhizobium sp. BK313]|uniref:hypothetical protein n=1 Tax=Rhizobium sp. BK313 TaxID=2587081 RepID=UPI0010D7F529|nr:hypothetical protein [Rhizobium sp. BK313]MBB3455213.1 hypothetical protein [Rhizobium sp. BK313]